MVSTNAIIFLVMFTLMVVGACWFLWWYLHMKIKEGIREEARKWSR